MECGFLTNPSEAVLLQNEEYQQKVAEAITEGVKQYLEQGLQEETSEKSSDGEVSEKEHEEKKSS